MKLNLFKKSLLPVGRWMTKTLLCLLAIVFVWQGAFFSDNAAMAGSNSNLIASKDAGDKVQEKASKDAGRAKGFIRDTADKVEEAAKSNAGKVERATDGDGNFIERKAKKDAARIEEKAEKDAARTQKAVDKTKNAVERTVDNIKDAFNK